MALLIRDKTVCSICGEIISSSDDVVMTSHFIRDQDDPLWRFSDSVIHRKCFLSWEHRAKFVARYNQDVGSITWGNGTYHHMQDDGSIQTLARK
jgi:hypothetical protein